MTITIGTQTFELTEEQVVKLKTVLCIERQLSDVAIGETFKVADIEFIKLEEKDGCVAAVTKDILFKARFDNETNNFAKSSLLKLLQKEILSKIGEDNVMEFETDLTSLDGLDDYGTVKSKISLPTLDLYRKYVRIFDKYKVNAWWWLSTPDSTPTHGITNQCRCVVVNGTLFIGNCDDVSNGVRPFLIFKSSIFVS